MKKNITTILAAFCLVAGLHAQKQAVIATVDVQEVLNNYEAFQQAAEKVQGSVAPVEEEMQQMQENMQGLMEEGREAQDRSQNPSLGEEARSEAQARVQELQGELQKKQQQLQQFRQQAEQLAEQGREEELAPLQQKAVATVEKVAKEKGIDLVVPTNGAIYSDDSLEITDSIIEALNKSED
ncbi:MAG: OmpH family outer membrane protein [Opitutales bacterium]